MTNEYKKFEDGFIKQAVELGVDEHFMRGYLKHAQDIVDAWQPYLSAAERIDKGFRMKVAADIILMGQKEALEKSAAEGFDIMGILDSLGKSFGGSSGLGGLIGGGGGGALIGLLLAKALGISPVMGLLLGGSLGGAGGYAYGKGNLFDNQALPADKQTGMNMEEQFREGTGPNPGSPNDPTRQPVPSTPLPKAEPVAGQVVQPAGAATPSAPEVKPPAAGMPTTPPTPAPAPGQNMAEQLGATGAPPKFSPGSIPKGPGASGSTLQGLGILPKPNIGGPGDILKGGSVNINEVLTEVVKQANNGMPSQGGDIDPQMIALLQQMLGSNQYQAESAQGYAQPNSQIVMDKPYDKDQGALNRLRDMGAENPEELMQPPAPKPKFNISQAFNNGHGPQQHVNNSGPAPGAPTAAPATAAKPMQAAKPGPLGFPQANIAQGHQQLQKQTQTALKASV